jgi:hypothetical protein
MSWYQLFKDFAGPVATILAAGAAVAVTATFSWRQVQIADRQAATALDQLRYNLFEKRYAVYTAAKELIEFTLNYSFPVSPTDGVRLNRIQSTLAEARFFFSDAICGFLDTLSKNCEGYRTRRRSLTPDQQEVDQLWNIFVTMPKHFGTELEFRQLTRRS